LEKKAEGECNTPPMPRSSAILQQRIASIATPAEPAAEAQVITLEATAPSDTPAEPVLTADVLLLDDLGANKPSPWAMETVGHVLNSRYNEKRVTLLTTNYLDTGPASITSPMPASAPTSMPASRRSFLPSGQAVAGAREENLTDRLGMRIRSRLYEILARTIFYRIGLKPFALVIIYKFLGTGNRNVYFMEMRVLRRYLNRDEE
jgi:hypothetical protein